MLKYDIINGILPELPLYINAQTSDLSFGHSNRRSNVLKWALNKATYKFIKNEIIIIHSVT
jgi:hypothetical protein